MSGVNGLLMCDSRFRATCVFYIYISYLPIYLWPQDMRCYSDSTSPSKITQVAVQVHIYVTSNLGKPVKHCNGACM